MKWPKLKLNDAVWVQWRDTVETSGWLDPVDAESRPAAIAWSLGFFLNRADGCLRISGTVCNLCGERNVTVIPEGVIEDVRVMK